MTMSSTRAKTMAAGQFKAKCLAVLDEVALSGREVVVTKRGVPVAKVVAMEAPKRRGKLIEYEGDLVSPIDVDWEAAK
jgi:prevent-host-death family protein